MFITSVPSPRVNGGISTTGTGTHDPTPFLSIEPGTSFRTPRFRWVLRHSLHTALEFRKWLGGEVKINEYCRSLAVKGGQKLAEILGTEEMDQTPNRELTLNMVRTLLPQVSGFSG